MSDNIKARWVLMAAKVGEVGCQFYLLTPEQWENSEDGDRLATALEDGVAPFPSLGSLVQHMRDRGLYIEGDGLELVR